MGRLGAWPEQGVMKTIRLTIAAAVGLCSLAAPAVAWGALANHPLHASPSNAVNSPELSVPALTPIVRTIQSSSLQKVHPEHGDDSRDGVVVPLGTLSQSDRASLQSRSANRATLVKALSLANVTITDPRGKLLHYPVNAPVSSPFGLRYHPILHVWRLHSGLDFAVPCGTPVGAAAAGTVTFAGVAGGYGNRVVVDNGVISGYHVSTAYNHLSGFGVKVGQKVTAGQGIAL